MKKLLVSIVAGAAAVACLGQAYAADLGYPAYKAPPLAAPVQSWTGLYIGANGGWGWANANATVSPFGPDLLADFWHPDDRRQQREWCGVRRPDRI